MNFAVNTEVEWVPGAKEKLKKAPDNILYTVAKITLDRTFPHIPMSRRKGVVHMRQTSMAAGVRGSNGNYYIGSYTDYAKYVWEMGDGTNWSTPNTFGKWYEKEFKKNFNNIVKTAIERNELR